MLLFTRFWMHAQRADRADRLSAGWPAGRSAKWLDVVRIGVPSLVVTIGHHSSGAASYCRNGRQWRIVGPDHGDFPLSAAGRTRGGIPMQFVWMIIVAIVTWFFSTAIAMALISI